ncbi:thaumatin family protein [Sporobolomyces salmoneus]|uniref:thaumatin family protein n=1 Tax=Sporobolomyces salmoneus TaxID=183962 RepID=UPI0031762B92
MQRPRLSGYLGLRALLLLSSWLRPLLAASTERSFTIKNNCDFTLWPAVTNYGTSKLQYGGKRGWEAKAGSQEELKIPSPWNGRVWARRECNFDSDGKGTCTTGNVDGGLEPKDQTIGNVNVGEFNLDAWGGNDFWDISCVPGWTVTMAIEPEPEDCQSIVCADDLNDACPDDRMKQKDSNGKVIGCLSACMAGINAQDPSINCCSGKYNMMENCPSKDVDFYSVLKPFCRNAYWYPYDYQPNTPTVDWACPASKNAAYTITFCPDGETTKNDSTIRAGGVTSVRDAERTTSADRDSGATATETVSTETLGSKGEIDQATSSSVRGSSSIMDSGSGANSAKVSASTSPATLVSSVSSSSGISFGEDYPRSVVYLAAAVAGLVLVTVVFLLCRCKRKQDAGVAQIDSAGEDNSGSSSEGEGFSKRGRRRIRARGKSFRFYPCNLAR